MIRVTNLSYNIGNFSLQNLSIEIAEEEYFVLLGKPGSGKTIFLECLCGLNRIKNGTIKIAGKDVTLAEPRDRGIGYVPQDYALFSTKSVRENIVFGLRVQGLDWKEIEERLSEITELLNIRHLVDRSIEGLSGGEQQKVALARALILKPKVLVLDEPVSALDEATREITCKELKRIHRKTRTTIIHVCHNFEETRIVAERIGILRDGKLIQVGPIDEVFAHPVDVNVANFLRVGNVLKGYATPTEKKVNITIGNTVFVADGVLIESPKEVEFALPEKNLSVSLNSPDNDLENRLVGNIVDTFPRGLINHIVIEIEPNLTITAFALPSCCKIGTKVHLSFPASAIHIF